MLHLPGCIGFYQLFQSHPLELPHRVSHDFGEDFSERTQHGEVSTDPRSLTGNAPKKIVGLEDKLFLLGFGNFSGANS